MIRNPLYLVVVALAVVAIILGYQLYKERQKTGLEINIGKSGISIDGK